MATRRGQQEGRGALPEARLHGHRRVSFPVPRSHSLGVPSWFEGLARQSRELGRQTLYVFAAFWPLFVIMGMGMGLIWASAVQSGP